MATSRTNIGSKFQNGDIPSNNDFEEIFDSFVHKDEDKADFQMVETGTDDQHYVTPALLRTGLQNIGIITGNSYMPFKEHFDNFSGTTLPLEKLPINFSVKAFKNGQLLLEGEDYTLNYDTATISFSGNIDNRNIEVDYWYKNLSPLPGGGSGAPIDFTSFLHTSGNETKNGILTFNNTTTTLSSGIVLTNSGADAAAKVLDITVSGTGSGVSLQNSASGTGVKLSNSGSGVGVSLNSTEAATGDILQVSKNNIVKVKIDGDGNVTAPNFVTTGGTNSQFVKGDGSLDNTVYAVDNDVIHTTGNESKDGALTLTHDSSAHDVLTITKNNSANCLKLVQNSSSNATTSTFDTTTENVNRKAVSIQKIGEENAFITHEGNVTGTSFTTLNEKADITDGLLTLAGSNSPVASQDHAKLYAKNDGTTTDIYVMGSDGLEKKIGEIVDLSGKENTVATGTISQYYRGDKTWQTLDKTAVGLGNVDNTSDLNKPVSTAGQTALNLKANLISPSLTGIPTAPTASVGTSTTQIATTSFVATADSNNVKTTGNQSVGGVKTFSSFILADADILFKKQGIPSYNVITAIDGGFSFGPNSGTNFRFDMQPTSILFGTGLQTATIGNNALTTPRTFSLPDKNGTFALLSDVTASSEPTQITITTAVSITTDTLDASSKKQLGKNVIINNGASAINITVNGGTDFCASYLKHGAGAITFVQAAGRTLVQVNATAVLNGAAGSTATISSIGTTDYLRISNI